jgi:hypothetical protein
MLRIIYLWMELQLFQGKKNKKMAQMAKLGL